MDSAQNSHQPCSHASVDQARDARARAMAYAFSCFEAKRKGARPDDVIVRSTEEVSHVDQRPN